ncbi:hypothetical protein [Amycolatopsis vancoresmycina]|uniref:Uncharacterized protein n=1 Tax=Amycolatopsis vancoresmycina DSM 44592 TaxID=1292037 RepID=R1FG26_9PSEU|nr:hypothetical protein [Amycolatopsis vancoresmycina]EOD58542.1 hypothetical protein H480_43205 [Amycolatopsis vancoresmycina DSM 44592]
MTTFCRRCPELVGPRNWLPPEPFEFGWAPAVGCNNLRCEHCGEPVRTQVPEAAGYRRYACACRRQDVYETYQVGGEPDDLYPALTGWACAGHPDFRLPATLDGVRLDETTDWATLVADALLRPPFEPPGVDLDAVWLTRLYRLLGAERALLGVAVAALLGSDDAWHVRGAYDFFYNEPAAAGADEVARSVAARRDWLRTVPDPGRPSSSLLDYAAVLLHERVLVVDEAGEPVDRQALAVAGELALAGIGPGHTPRVFGEHDPDWLVTHAADLARANERWVTSLVRTATRMPPEAKARILHDVAEVAPDRVRAAVRYL